MADSANSGGQPAPSAHVTERALAELWREVLELDKLPGAGDNFFALGGDSMTMIMLEFRIKEEFSVEIPPGSLLAAPSLRELYRVVLAGGMSLQVTSTVQ